MINKCFKLKLRSSKQFFDKAQRKKCDGLLLYFQKNNAHLQLSVVVGKKVANKAHHRNQLKRKIYNAINEILPQIKSWQLSVAVVIVNPQTILNEERLPFKLLNCLKEIK